MALPTRAQLQALHRRLGIPADYPVHRLPWQREARALVGIGAAVDDGRPVRLAPRAARAWRKMCRAAERDGVHLLPLSGYRSVRRQARIIRAKLAAGESIIRILRLVAAPGCSEHHTGRAVDVGSPANLHLDAGFGRTREFRWLLRHGQSFGFSLSYSRNNHHGIGYEPWHWCWHDH
ncbi:MAG: D-alanyl-D-alanine carboxypeptidase family protein [Verrucomicrobia bacterium]|nr:D-alanyl-D-alanine carboxypeptidase family protein [Verrucomicrobiota bacterium]